MLHEQIERAMRVLHVYSYVSATPFARESLLVCVTPASVKRMGGVKGTAVPAARRYANLAQGLSLMLPTLAESKSHQPCPVLIFVLSCDRDFTPDRNYQYY